MGIHGLTIDEKENVADDLVIYDKKERKKERGREREDSAVVRVRSKGADVTRSATRFVF